MEALHAERPAALRGRASPTDHPLVVVCGADDGFARPLEVTLYSALSNYCGALPVAVFIVDGGISPANRSRIDRMLGRLGVPTEWIQADWRPVQHLAVSERYPASIYLRLLLPSLLPRWVERALYLDSDLLVLGDIGELWDVDAGGMALLAVQDEGVPTVGAQWGLANHRELGLEGSAPYFNSGVLVLDLWVWREARIADQVIDYIAAHQDQMQFGEQDALNAVLATRWAALDPRWNQHVTPWEGYDSRQYRTGILHFVSTFKPWVPAGVHWTNFLFDRYLKRSGWYGPVAWWRYYLPLLLRRQQVLSERARRAAGAAPMELPT